MELVLVEGLELHYIIMAVHRLQNSRKSPNSTADSIFTVDITVESATFEIKLKILFKVWIFAPNLVCSFGLIYAQPDTVKFNMV